jgi:hypothetical protein
MRQSFVPRTACYRGGTLAPQHKEWYSPGKHFRVASFLSTSKHEHIVNQVGHTDSEVTQ